MAAGRELLLKCIEAGGTITGEHGVGLEKQAFMPLIFGPADLAAMARVRAAIDPGGLLNPAKVLPRAEPGRGRAEAAALRPPAEPLWV